MSEWISVKDRLPEIGLVWVCNSDGDICDAFYDGTGFKTTQQRILLRDVACWRPLDKPEPPEEYRPLKLEQHVGVGSEHRILRANNDDNSCHLEISTQIGYPDCIGLSLHKPSDLLKLYKRLTRREIAALIPILQRFVDTGSIKEES